MKSVLLFMTKSDSTVCVDHILFIHSSVSVNGCLGFHIFAIVNSAAMNICVPVWTRYFSSFTYTPRSAGLYSNSMFNLLRNCQTVSHGGCTILFIFSNVWLFWGSTYCIACCIELMTLKLESFWEFFGSPMVKPLHFHCRRPGFNPWSGN